MFVLFFLYCVRNLAQSARFNGVELTRDILSQCSCTTCLFKICQCSILPALSGKALQSYNLFFIPANFSAKIFVNPFPGRSPRQLFFKSECKVSDFIFTHQIFLKVFVKENYKGLVDKWVRLVIGGRAGALSGSGGGGVAAIARRRRRPLDGLSPANDWRESLSDSEGGRLAERLR